MPDGFTVDTAQIHAHAASTQDLAGRADVATDAGAHLSTLDDAYGLFCRSFGEMLVQPQQRGAEALANSADHLHRTVRGLTETAEAYETAEERIAAAMEALVRQLDVAARGIPTVGGR
jgi:methyl-accepting chemotaxis protein